MTAMRPHFLSDFSDRCPARKVTILDRSDDMLPFWRIRCADLRNIGRAWLAMPREEGAAVPPWHAFSPAAFASCLDKLCVIKAGDWRAHEIEFSLCGDHPTEFLGNGRPFVLAEMRRDPLQESIYFDILNRAGRAIENGMPQYVRKSMAWNDRNFIEYESLMLPFAAEGGVQRLLQPVSARARVIRSDARRPGDADTPLWCEMWG